LTPTLVFDIETVPDCAGLRRLHAIDPGVSDKDVAEFAFQRRRASHNTDFLPLHLHRVVAISCAMREGDGFRVWSLGSPQDSEKVLIQRFFDGIDKYTPTLVSWNGGGFDLPVLHYRGMVHGVSAPRYWDQGEDDREFKWNNYISRYHSRHTDVMDLAAMYQARAYAPLDEMAQLIGLPGKLGMDGSQVWQAYQDGKLDEIRNYCETDVVNTWLVYARFQLLRGVFDADRCAAEFDLVRATLSRAKEPHWQQFLAAWPVDDGNQVAGA
jgi:predicted PolB exonuclease-like 3'-5' exonuclease